MKFLLDSHLIKQQSYKVLRINISYNLNCDGCVKLRGHVNNAITYLLNKRSLHVLGTKIQSSIIQSDGFLLSQFSRFMEPVAGSHPHWKLCYRASSYGWSSSTFHSNCDGKRDTVTIIRKNQYVFGGYTDIPWGMYLI